MVDYQGEDYMEKLELKCHYWNAVTHTGFPFKRFIKASKGNDSENNLPLGLEETKNVTNLSGTDIKEFYETTINQNIRSKILNKSGTDYVNKNVHKPNTRNTTKIELNETKFFQAATYNDVHTLNSFEYKNNLIDSTDQYGWTALMMASCENSFEAVKFLLLKGANKNLCDKKGNSALSLSKRKGFSNIVELLIKHGKNDESQLSNVDIKSDHRSTFKYFCSICDKEFNIKNKREHETSTVHLFNTKRGRKNFRYASISNSNRGLKLMLKQGWDRESGLGPERNGNLFPIKTVIRKTRSGLGIQQESAKVTHFKPYDLNAIKYKAHPKTKSRNDIRREHRRNQKIERRLRNELS